MARTATGTTVWWEGLCALRDAGPRAGGQPAPVSARPSLRGDVGLPTQTDCHEDRAIKCGKNEHTTRIHKNAKCFFFFLYSKNTYKKGTKSFAVWDTNFKLVIKKQKTQLKKKSH